MDDELKNDLKQHIRKTGTTTVGIVCKDGIIIAADTRGTYGSDRGVTYIASKDEKKIEKVGDNIVVTTAGVASDLQKVIKLVRAELRLKELKSKEKPTIKQAANLFASVAYQNIRQPSMILGITHFLLAGYDNEGFYLYDIHPDGYLQKIEEYSSTGSGMIHINPILDSDYKKEITLKEGIDLALKLVNASMKRDPATGEGIEVYTVTNKEVKQVAKKEVVTDFKDK